MIKTPDQRVRVFISSTINELADERRAAREAISNLRLIPVFFEAGARPHPPRELYSAYLQQSHIFLGIYGDSYGWMAPGSEISGLEHEYRLCSDRQPKLIYVKRSTERHPRLQELLQDIERSDSACYQYFADVNSLRALIENDLSVLLSERFEHALLQAAQQATHDDANADTRGGRIDLLPHIRSAMFGREDDLRLVGELLMKPGTSVVTVLGTGGTGKTTLAIHVGHLVNNSFRDGVAFVSLASVTDHRLVAAAIAEALGVQDSGKQAIEATLSAYLSDKELLLILDNFEQVAAASRMVSELVTRCKGLKVLATSRTSLHVRHERIYHLDTLALPDDGECTSPEQLRVWPATRMFVERALEVNPHLLLNRENTEAIIDICQRMDGLPLAIELAAARTRFFQPSALMSRIEKTLDLACKCHHDLPERQRTLRGAIEWSYDLLSTDTQRVFRQLGVFRGSWTMEAAGAILNVDGIDLDIEEMTERLLDVSLIKPELIGQTAEPRFRMLQTVHEYALEQLEAAAEALATEQRFAAYYLRLLEETDGKLLMRNGDAWQDLIERDYQNIRASFQLYVQWADLQSAWRHMPHLTGYWMIRGGFSEVAGMIAAARITDSSLWDSAVIDPAVRARTLTWTGLNLMFLFDLDTGFRMLDHAIRIAEAIGDERTLAHALGMSGCYGSHTGRPGAGEKIERSLLLAEKHDESLALAVVLIWSWGYYEQQGRPDTVMANLDRAEHLAEEKGMLYFLASGRTLRFGHESKRPIPDWERMARESRELFHMLPAKGYASLKAASMQILSYAQLRLGRIDEAAAAVRHGLQHSRQAGETEYEVDGVISACIYHAIRGDLEKALRLMGAVDAVFAASGYHAIGVPETQYAHAKALLDPHRDAPDGARWYADGKRMTLADAIQFALPD